jgi:adenosine deaminase
MTNRPGEDVQRAAGPVGPIPEELIRSLPKTDLHVHLDGSLRPSTVWELAQEQGLDLGAKDVEELTRMLQIGDERVTLPEYLERFQITLRVLQTREALRRAAFELAEDAAAENVRYMEVRYSPILHRERGLDLPEIVDAVLEGLRDAEARYPIRTGVILCGIRHISPDMSYRLAELTLEYKNRGVVGFDLAGAEKDFPAKHHREAFYLILNNNINCTAHAGEAFGPASISQALHYCGAHRIGHGTLLREDPDLLEYVNDHRIPLEMCLTSNVETGAASSFEDHPFKFYHDRGLRVTVNTDNRLMSNTTVTRELTIACHTFNLSIYDLRNIIINGFKSAFLSFDEKRKLLRSVLAEMDALLHDAYPETYDVERAYL